jgi:hypothetical protein
MFSLTPFGCPRKDEISSSDASLLFYQLCTLIRDNKNIKSKSSFMYRRPTLYPLEIVVESWPPQNVP